MLVLGEHVAAPVVKLVKLVKLVPVLSVSRTCLYLASRSLPQSSSAECIGLGLASAVAACVSSAGLLSFCSVSGMGA